MVVTSPMLEYRKKNNLSQAEAAKLCGTTQSRWSHLEIELSQPEVNEIQSQSRSTRREPDPLQIIIDHENVTKLREKISTALNEREQAILYLMLEGWSLYKISRVLNVSRQRMWQIQMVITKKLRYALRKWEEQWL